MNQKKMLVCALMVLAVQAMPIYAAVPWHKKITYIVRADGTRCIDPDQDLEHAEQDGRTLLMIALIQGKKELARDLVVAGADVNARLLTTGRGVLHQLHYAGYEDMVQVMIDAGADLDGKGYTYRLAPDPFRPVPDGYEAQLMAAAEVDLDRVCGGDSAVQECVYGFHSAEKLQQLINAGAYFEDEDGKTERIKCDIGDGDIKEEVLNNARNSIVALCAQGVGRETMRALLRDEDVRRSMRETGFFAYDPRGYTPCIYELADGTSPAFLALDEDGNHVSHYIALRAWLLEAVNVHIAHFPTDHEGALPFFDFVVPRMTRVMTLKRLLQAHGCGSAYRMQLAPAIQEVEHAGERAAQHSLKNSAIVGKTSSFYYGNLAGDVGERVQEIVKFEPYCWREDRRG